MNSLSHVFNFQPMFDLLDSISKTIKFSIVDMFLLESPDEAFNDPIFCWATFGRHTNLG